MNPLVAALLGTLTAVGGGCIRDILLNEVPVILRQDVYAVAALAGATAMVIGARQGLPRGTAMTLGAGVCFALRVLSASQYWNLPRVR
jgi:uncharacterized membrane protein YeiH